MRIAKALGVIGAVVVWLPIVAPFVFSIVSLLVNKQFRFDFLMPAELFLLVILGGILLLVSAHLSKDSKKFIGISLGTAVTLLVLSQGIAVITGLADGRIGASGWQAYVVLGMIGLFDISVVSIGVAGIKLLRIEFEK